MAHPLPGDDERLPVAHRVDLPVERGAEAQDEQARIDPPLPQREVRPRGEGVSREQASGRGGALVGDDGTEQARGAASQRSDRHESHDMPRPGKIEPDNLPEPGEQAEHEGDGRKVRDEQAQQRPLALDGAQGERPKHHEERGEDAQREREDDREREAVTLGQHPVNEEQHEQHRQHPDARAFEGARVDAPRGEGAGERREDDADHERAGDDRRIPNEVVLVHAGHVEVLEAELQPEAQPEQPRRLCNPTRCALGTPGDSGFQRIRRGAPAAPALGLFCWNVFTTRLHPIFLSRTPRRETRCGRALAQTATDYTGSPGKPPNTKGSTSPAAAGSSFPAMPTNRRHVTVAPAVTPQVRRRRDAPAAHAASHCSTDPRQRRFQRTPSAAPSRPRNRTR